MLNVISSLLLIFGVNFLVYSCANYLSLFRPILNIDYVIVSVVLVFGYKKISHLLWCIVFLADILLCVGQIFPFFRLSDVFYILQFTWLSSIYYKFAIVILFGIIFLYISLNHKVDLSKKIILPFFIIFSFLYTYEQVLGDGTENKITSQLSEFVGLQFFGFHQSVNSEAQDLERLPHPSLANEYLRKLIQNSASESPNILFIVSESLGLSRNTEAFNSLISPLLGNKKIKNFNIDVSTYVGATVQAELRELCQASSKNFNLKDSKNDFNNCLPNFYKKKGYETMAIHGAFGLMYDRKYWYPTAGFDQVLFKESRHWKTRCYSFPGICDYEFFPFISEQFKSNQPQFLYWLTLNSHAIYDKRDIFSDRFDCMEYQIQLNSESCRNLKLHAQFFYQLSDTLLQPHFSNTIVIIVGDHSPIILNQTEKEKIFKNDDVPVISFIVD